MRLEGFTGLWFRNGSSSTASAGLALGPVMAAESGPSHASSILTPVIKPGEIQEPSIWSGCTGAGLSGQRNGATRACTGYPMRTDLFDYDLPKRFIAQAPAEPRDSSRLLVLERATGRVEHRRFGEIGLFLRAGDLLVANDSRVIPARLRGHKPTGGAVEVFLLHKVDDDGWAWRCLVRGRGLGAGAEVELDARPVRAQIVSEEGGGLRTVRFSEPIGEELSALGEIPLPPYIRDFRGDRGRYQTVYGRVEGSAAAPTAGLHFTAGLLRDLAEGGVDWETVTLHVGLDTFGPVTAERVSGHRIHREWAELPAAVAEAVNSTRRKGGRTVSVGTTSARTLEYAATGAQGIEPYGADGGREASVAPFAAEVDLFIYPGYSFRAVDALLTNFHLPRSSLLMLVSAFVGQAHPQDEDKGREILLRTYEVAKREGYRFYSFGDAMLII